uniref:Uncharacterized protein n=1 Tax=Calidris pygmaea TaxID=425635 RepID=A0A8C3K988_9CHAR
AQALSPPPGAGAMPAPESRSVFEAAKDPVLLQGLTLVTGVAAEAWEAEPAPARHESVTSGHFGHGSFHGPPRPSCLIPISPQTEHYRLDWHRFNLKQRLLGRRTLPVEAFEEKTRTGDVSSISGSDSESSDTSSESEELPSASDNPGAPPTPSSHKVLLRNAKGQLISAYRCVLGVGKGQASSLPGSISSPPLHAWAPVAHACPSLQPPGAGAQDLPPLYSASPAWHGPGPTGCPDARIGTQVSRSLPAALQRGCAAQGEDSPQHWALGRETWSWLAPQGGTTSLLEGMGGV